MCHQWCLLECRNLQRSELAAEIPSHFEKRISKDEGVENLCPSNDRNLSHDSFPHRLAIARKPICGSNAWSGGLACSLLSKSLCLLAATLVKTPEGEIPLGGDTSFRPSLDHWETRKLVFWRLIDKTEDMFVSSVWRVGRL